MSPKATFTTTSEASVEYRLLRDALAKAVRLGKVSHEDACDAHPELVRAATNLGKSTGEKCPDCGGPYLVEKYLKAGAFLQCPDTACKYKREMAPAAIEAVAV